MDSSVILWSARGDEGATRGVCQRNDRVYVRHAGSDVLSYNITRFVISFGRAGWKMALPPRDVADASTDAARRSRPRKPASVLLWGCEGGNGHRERQAASVPKGG